MKQIIVIVSMLCCSVLAFGQSKVTSESESMKQQREINVEAGDNQPFYESVEVMPQYPGGTQELMKYLTTTMRYPKSAQKKGIQGRVLCTFIVEKDGSISDVKVPRSVDPDLDKEAIRVVKSMKKWKPGLKDGKPVRVKFTLPITFHL